MKPNAFRAAAFATVGLVLASTGVPANAAKSGSVSSKPTTSCSDWQGIGDSTVSARTCITVKAGKKTSEARGSVQVKNTGNVGAKVTATWTLVVDEDDRKPAKVKTVKASRSVPANGRTYKLGGNGKFNKLDATALAEVQSKIVVVAAKTGTDTEKDESPETEL